MFPTVTLDSKYHALKERWLTGEEPGHSNLDEFLEIKRGLRGVTFVPSNLRSQAT